VYVGGFIKSILYLGLMMIVMLLKKAVIVGCVLIGIIGIEVMSYLMMKRSKYLDILLWNRNNRKHQDNSDKAKQKKLLRRYQQ
jgi:hypothetical protein